MQPPGAPAPLAEWWQRLVARIVDGVIFGVVMGLVSFIFGLFLVASYSSTTGASTGLFGSFVIGILMSVVLTLVYVGYDFFMHKMKGQTVGKMIMGIKVVQVGGPVPPGGIPNDAALKRALGTWGAYILYWLPFGTLLAPLLCGLNGASMLWDKPLQQTFADKFARTVVVKIK
ncbi:RDD family protein [Nonomuraea turcica]|uniref:RDD family protein n=1 Tax=Nonomuraea sp. G32 TaxID=3067274 RepID=UPI00273BEBC2|nr:RDD family protein [Nonomuraea sp. G32]MDP4503649.1 RDD family protein [Nonomuraea sp. G32]